VPVREAEANRHVALGADSPRDRRVLAGVELREEERARAEVLGLVAEPLEELGVGVAGLVVEAEQRLVFQQRGR